MHSPTTFFEDDAMRISGSLGAAGTAVVAFAGVGNALGSVPIEEFRKSISESACAQSTIFVIDKSRSWYNDRRFLTLADRINTLVDRSQAESVVTLGSSMGATGAIRFAGSIRNCHRAIAFSPQFSVHSDIVPFEQRWLELRSRIKCWQFMDACDTISDQVDYLLLFGSRSAEDIQHMKCFRRHPKNARLNIMFAENCGHNIPLPLRSRGRLAEFLRISITQGSGAADDLKRTLGYANLNAPLPH